ncbi:hypothetical protein AAHE18_12G005100 [Arachis hypogaea]
MNGEDRMSSESVKQSYLKSEEKIRDDSQNGEEGAARGRRGDGDGNRTIASRTNLMEDGRRARKKTENGGSTWITPTVRRETPRMATDGGSGSLSSAAVEERMKVRKERKLEKTLRGFFFLFFFSLKTT